MLGYRLICMIEAATRMLQFLLGAMLSVDRGFGHRLWAAAAVTVAFTVLARWLRGVSFSGSIAGAIVCFVLYAAAGPGAFAALVSVFVLTWIATRFGYRRKQSLGTAEHREGRTGRQVVANLMTATVSAIAFMLNGNTHFLVAAAAALSEAAADTVSSELGQAQSDRARLITTWQIVPAGTDGGVTPIGTIAGIVAAAIVSGVCLVARLVSLRWAAISIIAGVTGMIADSYLGALFERRKLLNNDWVNFLSTVVAAAVALLFA
jgi:uncharacterized protein (TIGR00297 family)